MKKMTLKKARSVLKKARSSAKRVSLFITPFTFLDSYYAEATQNQPQQATAQYQRSHLETVKVLQNLTQAEIDASFLLTQTIDNIKKFELKEKILALKRECENNIKELSNLINKYGGKSPTCSKDFKGYFMNGYAAIRGAFTDEGVLKALHTNLKLINKSFESAALNAALPQDIKDTVRKIHEHNKEDISDIETQI